MERQNMCKMCSNLKIKTPERRHSGVLIIKFEHFSHIFCFIVECFLTSYCWPETLKYLTSQFLEIYSSISLVLGCVKLSNTALQHFHDLLLPAYIFETSFSTFVTWFSKKLRMDQSKLGIPCAAIYC